MQSHTEHNSDVFNACTSLCVLEQYCNKKTTMLPNNKHLRNNAVANNRGRRQQQQAPNNAFAIAEAAAAPPNPPVAVPCLEGFHAPPALVAAAPSPKNEYPSAPPAQQPAISAPPRPRGCPRRAPGCQLTLRQQYFPALLTLMCWKDGRIYAPDHEFSREELLTIHADHVYRHFKDRVYGDPDADECSTPPLHFRLHSVLAWERNISYFMPNNRQQWNDARQEGNPTRSLQLSRLIKAIRRFQTQRHGVASSVRRPLTTGEYEQVMEAYWRAGNRELGLCGAALTSFQLSMIGRLDDCSKFRLPELLSYAAYPDWCITGKLNWSKNVVDERDCPHQVLIGAMDTRYDVLLNLGLWLKYHFELNPGENEFVFGYSGLDDPIRIKERLARQLKEILLSDSFMCARAGLLGTHSVRKMAVTFARGTGCTKVSIDCVLFFESLFLTWTVSLLSG